MPNDSAVLVLLSGVLVGALAEGASARLGLCSYSNPRHRSYVVILRYGAYEGLAFSWWFGHGQDLCRVAPLLFLIGAADGLFAEYINARVWPLWRFRTDCLAMFKTQQRMAMLSGLAWGVVPVAILALSRAVEQLLGL